ncbi:DoxX family protein [Larkinella terrae]|uniref:DoxX family protein n=1 Tax=Larkinella terrae TaxID=2025311 RepID=A0A7K0EX99_9BACT|nr:DoxX family protein [Larkinella terrae]MRS65941.1 DoxX family protein [Larkinella terrae]
MDISLTLDRLHNKVKQNKWLRYFAVFNRIALAAGFLPSGFVKIMGERFTNLSNNHPMGHYLEALHHTGYYYTFIGILQMTAAVLLLIPRTAVLGAVLYFPIILNICILSLAVRFDGSLLSSPLMVLANLYLLCWYYDRLKFILPFNRPAVPASLPDQKALTTKFPTLFFAGVAATVFLVGLILTNVFTIRPRNTLSDCQSQCRNSENPQACREFCDCIHNQGQPLDDCLKAYNQATATAGRTP